MYSMYTICQTKPLQAVVVNVTNFYIEWQPILDGADMQAIPWSCFIELH